MITGSYAKTNFHQLSGTTAVERGNVSPARRITNWCPEKPCFSHALYRNRNAIERMSGRIEGFRRNASRYDKLARNFLTAVYLVATVSYWL